MQVYLTTLEATKSWSLDTAARIAPSEAGQAGLSNLFAGAVASLVTQSVIVPIDVVSQRLMVAGEPASGLGRIIINPQDQRSTSEEHGIPEWGQVVLDHGAVSLIQAQNTSTLFGGLCQMTGPCL